ncbi:MAG: transporter [Verrucomicrobia bacterium]|jgi:hypothetical protein|nr:transporter [Verrucomicrobiota bacterium]
MKNQLNLIAPLAAGAGLCLAAQAQHYPIGVEGIKGGSLPPPGVYLRDYNLFYWADQVNDHHGDKLPVDFDLFVYAQAPRLIWITDFKILGGSYGMDTLIPFIYTDLSAGPYSDSKFDLGDIFFEPITLSWHWKQFDLGVGYGFWAPTGNRGEPVDAGKGFWGHMLTLGGTWFPDQQKTWALSALGRYEINHEMEDAPITPGNEISLEWGLSKALSKSWEVGAIGYWQQQLTGDSGSGASGELDSVWGLGPEIVWSCGKCMTFVSARYIYEIEASSRPQGHTATLTLTKRF